MVEVQIEGVADVLDVLVGHRGTGGHQHPVFEHTISVWHTGGWLTERRVAHHWLPSRVAGPDCSRRDAVFFEELLQIRATDAGAGFDQEAERLPSRVDFGRGPRS